MGTCPLRNGNEIAGPPKILQCGSDEEAIALASTLIDGLDMEIWQRARVVIRLQPNDQ